MKKSTLIIIITLVIAFVGLGIFISTKNTKEKEAESSLYDVYDPNSIISANENNGGIGDHVKGLVEGVEPELIIYEYADYQCPGCATTNPWVNEVLDSFEGKVAIVFRSLLIKDHFNSKAAGAAVEAAGLQGYWKKYLDLLYLNQTEWGALSGTKRTEKFVEYFDRVSGENGDSEKFLSDLAGDAVLAKVNFDNAISKKVGVSATPSFYIDGEEIDWIEEGGTSAQTKTGFISFFKNKISKKLSDQKTSE